MTNKSTWISLVFCWLVWPVFAQKIPKSITGTWILEYNNNLMYNSPYAIAEEGEWNNFNTKNNEQTILTIENKDITYTGESFYLYRPSEEEAIEIGEEVEGEEEGEWEEEEVVEKEWKEEEEEVVEEEWVEEDVIYEYDLPRSFEIVRMVAANEESGRIIFKNPQQKTLYEGYFGILEYKKTIHAGEMQLIAYLGFETLELAEAYVLEKGDWLKSNIYFSQKMHKKLNKKAPLKDLNYEQYLDFWENYLAEVERPSNQKILENINFSDEDNTDFYLRKNSLGSYNPLSSNYWSTYLLQRTLIAMGYNPFQSSSGLYKAFSKYGYDQEVRRLIRGEIPHRDIAEIQQKMNGEWVMHLMMPYDNDTRGPEEVMFFLSIDYPTLVLNIEVDERNIPPEQRMPAEFKRIVFNITKIVPWLSAKEGSIILKFPERLAREGENYMVLGYHDIEEEEMYFTLSNNSPVAATIKEAEKMYIDNTFSFTLWFLKKERFEAYQQLPPLEITEENHEEISKKIEERKGSIRDFISFSAITEKKLFIEMGYHPIASLKNLKAYYQAADYKEEAEYLEQEMADLKEHIATSEESLAKAKAEGNEEEVNGLEISIANEKRYLEKMQRALTELELKMDLIKAKQGKDSLKVQALQAQIQEIQIFEEISRQMENIFGAVEDIDFIVEEIEHYLEDPVSYKEDGYYYYIFQEEEEELDESYTLENYLLDEIDYYRQDLGGNQEIVDYTETQIKDFLETYPTSTYKTKLDALLKTV